MCVFAHSDKALQISVKKHAAPRRKTPLRHPFGKAGISWYGAECLRREERNKSNKGYLEKRPQDAILEKAKVVSGQTRLSESDYRLFVKVLSHFFRDIPCLFLPLTAEFSVRTSLFMTAGKGPRSGKSPCVVAAFFTETAGREKGVCLETHPLIDHLIPHYKSRSNPDATAK